MRTFLNKLGSLISLFFVIGICFSMSFANPRKDLDETLELKTFQRMIDSQEFDAVLERAQAFLLNLNEENNLFSIASYFAGVASFEKKNYLQSSRFFLNYKSNENVGELDELANFYRALNLVRLGYKRPALKALNQFKEKYTNSYFYPEVIYQISLINYGFNNAKEALKSLNKLTVFHSDNDLKIRSHILKGKVFTSLNRYPEAEAEFLKAKNFSDSDESNYYNDALCLLVKASGQQYRWSDSLYYYEQLMANNPSQFQKVRAAAYVMISMEQMDKIDEGINALEQSLFEFKEPYLYDVCHESINVYLSYLRKKHTSESVNSRIKNLFSESNDENPLIELWAFVGLEFLENTKLKNNSEIKVYYQNIVERFEFDSLSNRSLVKIADYFFKIDPQTSINCYRKIISRGNSEYILVSLLRLHKLYTQKNLNELIKSTEQELHYAASVYGDVFFQSLTEDEKNLFKRIMDSQKKSNLDSNNISEILRRLILPKRLALRKIAKLD